MNNKRFLKIAVLMIFALSVAGCTAQSQSTASEATDTISTPEANLIIAEGNLEPVRAVNLLFRASGAVDEVNVHVGDEVKEGDVLARLSGYQQAEAQIAAAKLELTNAQQALDDVYANAQVVAAQTLQSIEDSRDAERDSQNEVNNLVYGSYQPDIDQAFANMILAKDKLDKAKDDYEPYADKPDDNLTRATYLSKMAEAQDHYDDTVRHYNYLIGDVNDIDLAQAQADLAYFQALIEKLNNDYSEVKDGSPNPDTLATAQARVDNAEAQLAAAQELLTSYVLVAPFNGQVADVSIRVGDQINPQSQTISVADKSSWVIETTDISELNIVDLTVGQEVTFTADALPDSVEMKGVIEEISQAPFLLSNDVVYMIRIAVDEVDPRVKWGMTVELTFSGTN